MTFIIVHTPTFANHGPDDRIDANSTSKISMHGPAAYRRQYEQTKAQCVIALFEMRS